MSDGDIQCPIFVSQYSIVKGIFENLPIRDLLSASQVCIVWSEVARVVRKQRKNVAQTFLWHPYGEHTAEVFEYYNGHSVSDEVAHFMNTASGMGYPTVDELNDQTWSPLFPQLRSAIIKDFNSSFSEPQLMVVVATASINENLSDEDEDNANKLKIILSDIPRAIPCLVSFSYGIVGSIKDQVTSLEMENFDVPLVAGLSIPKLPGFSVKIFTVTKETNNKFWGKVDKESCKTILSIRPEDNVKAIVLFHTQESHLAGGALKNAVFHYIKSHPHVCLGGGAHYKNLASVCEGDFAPIGAGLIICGNDNVNVASIGLYDTKISKRNEDKLIEMKGCEFIGGDSFAFMFANYGRGANMHGGKTHVESTLFRKHFPKTALIGTFTWGEYCHEVIPSRGVPGPPKKPSSIEFDSTTVFVFVSYKYPTKHSVRS